MVYDDDCADEEWVDEETGSEDDLLICPSCREPVHEDTQQCPHCGDWITPVWPARTSTRLIWTIAATLVIISFTVLALIRLL